MKKILIFILFMAVSIATFAQLKVFADGKVDIYRQSENSKAVLAVKKNNYSIRHSFQEVAFPKRIPMSKVEHPIRDDDEGSIPHTTFGAIPQVDYENHTITFYSNTQILSMEVTIKDKKGTVSYHDYVNITNGVTTIKLTEKESENAFSIELFYADIHVSGYFVY